MISSPSSSLNSKKITSQDDIGGVTGSGAPVATPLTGLQPGSRVTASRDDSSIASGSSGFGSLTKKKNDFHSVDMDPISFASSIVTDSGISENSSDPTYSMDTLSSASANHQHLLHQPGSGLHNTNLAQSNNAAGEQGHSRNSSNTSQVN